MASPLSPDAIKAAVASALSQDVNIPAGHRGALVTLANLDHMSIAMATRVGDNWFVELTGSHEWTGDNQIGVISKLTW